MKILLTFLLLTSGVFGQINGDLISGLVTQNLGNWVNQFIPIATTIFFGLLVLDHTWTTFQWMIGDTGVGGLLENFVGKVVRYALGFITITYAPAFFGDVIDAFSALGKSPGAGANNPVAQDVATWVGATVAAMIALATVIWVALPASDILSFLDLGKADVQMWLAKTLIIMIFMLLIYVSLLSLTFIEAAFLIAFSPFYIAFGGTILSRHTAREIFTHMISMGVKITVAIMLYRSFAPMALAAIPAAMVPGIGPIMGSVMLAFVIWVVTAIPEKVATLVSQGAAGFKPETPSDKFKSLHRLNRGIGQSVKKTHYNREKGKEWKAEKAERSRLTEGGANNTLGSPDQGQGSQQSNSNRSQGTEAPNSEGGENTRSEGRPSSRSQASENQAGAPEGSEGGASSTGDGAPQPQTGGSSRGGIGSTASSTGEASSNGNNTSSNNGGNEDSNSSSNSQGSLPAPKATRQDIQQHQQNMKQFMAHGDGRGINNTGQTRNMTRGNQKTHYLAGMAGEDRRSSNAFSRTVQSKWAGAKIYHKGDNYTDSNTQATSTVQRSFI